MYAEFNLHINLSDLYIRYKNEKALKAVYYQLLQAKSIQQKLDDSNLLFFLNFNFGGYYKQKKQFPTAIEYYKKALNTINKNTPSNQVLNLYHTLSEAYVQNNDYKNALQIKEKQNKLSETIFTIKKNKAFDEIQTKYEVDKKNLKIQLLTKDKIIQSRRKQIILIVGGIIIVFLLIFLLFYKQRVKTQKIIAENENKIHSQEVARLESEKELKRILGVVEGQDQERNRLAQDIHDGIGGALAGIKLELSQVNTSLKNNKIDQIITKMQTAFNELRLISHNLSVSSLKEKEFDFLLNKLKEEYKSRGEFDTEIIIFPENAMNAISHNTRYQLFRVIQELFTNTSKHAKASKVVLSCTVFDEQINVIFEDNGSGFDCSKETGIGLRNIQERLSVINGTIVIESNKGTGTTIIIDIPRYGN
ncbi:sensor histidine kinase [Flavobacterium sp.]|uniref:sensor histidine kinase n=1 Tax=Flavobacterium sp. TaxID=239 RepID=UPI0037BE4B8A